MRAQDLMSHPAITCNVNDTLELAAKLVLDRNCGSVVVVREDVAEHAIRRIPNIDDDPRPLGSSRSPI